MEYYDRQTGLIVSKVDLQYVPPTAQEIAQAIKASVEVASLLAKLHTGEIEESTLNQIRVAKEFFGINVPEQPNKEE